MDSQEKFEALASLWDTLEDMWDLLRGELQPEMQLPSWSVAIASNETVRDMMETFLKLEGGPEMARIIEQPVTKEETSNGQESE